MNGAMEHQEGRPGAGRPARSVRWTCGRSSGPLARGAGDPTMRVAAAAAIRASVTPDGPGAIEIRVDGATARARAWGPGAAVLLDGLPALLGLDDDRRRASTRRSIPWSPQLARRRGPVRLGRTVAVWDALLPAILEQRITGTEAWRNYRRLVRAHGVAGARPAGAAAGADARDRRGAPAVAPDRARDRAAARVAPPTDRAGGRHGTRRSRRGARAPGAGGAGAGALAAALRAQPGIGPWTAAEVTLRALGDPDAVSVGDAHLSNVVAFALAGRPRGTDEEMLELLAPWAGHRARVVRLLEGAGITPPRYGPRVAPRDLARDYGRAPARREPADRRIVSADAGHAEVREVAARARRAIRRRSSTRVATPDTTRRPMFGHPCAWVGGNMATGLFAQHWWVRLPPDELAAVLASGEATDVPGHARPRR